MQLGLKMHLRRGLCKLCLLGLIIPIGPSEPQGAHFGGTALLGGRHLHSQLVMTDSHRPHWSGADQWPL